MRLRGGGMERKDRGEEWIIRLRQRKVRVERNESANRATDGAPPLTKLLHLLFKKYCRDLQGNIGNILQYLFISFILFVAQESNDKDAT